MEKYSKQRQAILNNLINRTDHPTAEMVYSDVRKDQPNISLGTVYRNLSLLEKQCRINRITTGLGPDRYDGCTKPHIHFVCKCCGKVYDMDKDLSNIVINNCASFDGEIDGYELKFFGRCKDCLIQEERK